MRNILYRVLELPNAYNLVTRLIGLGGMAEVRALFAEFLDAQEHKCILELGCGTGAWPATRYQRYIRTDINELYFPASAPPGVEFRKVDATNLSCFADGTFDLVYSAGLYHHLPDEAVVRSLQESARVLVEGGTIVVFDAILPTSAYNLPARILRRLDRGEWVRAQSDTTALLERAGLAIRRERCCRWGPRLEGCFWEAAPQAPAKRRDPP